MSRPATVTPNRKKILKMLYEWKFGTTSQIWHHLYPGKHIQYTHRDLAALRNLGLVRSFPVEPELGRASELCWLITRAGVEDELGYQYGTQYARKQGREVIAFRSTELLFVRKIIGDEAKDKDKDKGKSKGDKWRLLIPQNYNAANPKPDDLFDRTAQAKHLIKSVAWVDGKFSPGYYDNSEATDFMGKPRTFTWETLSALAHRNPIRIPPHINDYMAVQETETDYIAIPIMLAHPRAGKKYWESRYALYEKIGHSAYVVPLVIFPNEAECMDMKDELEKHNIKSAIVTKTLTALKEAKIKLYEQKGYLQAIRSMRRR